MRPEEIASIEASKRVTIFHSKSLPYYGKEYVSFFDEAGIEHKVKPEDFKDITTEGGRATQYYTYEVRGGGSGGGKEKLLKLKESIERAYYDMEEVVEDFGDLVQVISPETGKIVLRERHV